MGVDRWLHAAEACEVTVKPLQPTVQKPQNTQMHIHSTLVLPTFPDFFFYFTFLICIYVTFWCHSWTFWRENGTCHIYWEVKYTVAHSKNMPNQKPKAAHLPPFLYCLHVYCLVVVLLNKSIVLFLSAHSRWRCQRMAEFRVKNTDGNSKPTFSLSYYGV